MAGMIAARSLLVLPLGLITKSVETERERILAAGW
jgi:hypothetical protein